MQLIARGIAVEFGQPPFTTVRWRGAVSAALVPVPKAAVDEDDGLVLGQHHVRPTRKFLSVQPETIAEPMQQRANDPFRCRVLAVDPAHVPTAAFFTQSVTHKN